MVSSTPYSISVSWEEPHSNGSRVLHYNIQYRSSSSKQWRTIDVEIISTTFEISTGLQQYQEYQIQVRARNSIGWSKWSESSSVRTQALTPTLSDTSYRFVV